jgi:hypothetical protein
VPKTAIDRAARAAAHVLEPGEEVIAGFVGDVGAMRFGISPAYHVVLTSSRALLFVIGPRTKRAVLLTAVPRGSAAIDDHRRGVVADRVALTLGNRSMNVRVPRAYRAGVAAIRGELEN